VNNDLKFGEIEFSGYVDKDGEVEVRVRANYEDDVYEWLTKDDAKQLVQHLVALFGKEIICE